MKLVNAHKLIVLFLLLTAQTAFINAQQVWPLDQCINTALEYNKNVIIEQNNVKIGQIRAKEAKSSLIPMLNLSADYKYFTDLPTQLMPVSAFNPAAPSGQFMAAQFGVPHNINTNIQLSMPLYNNNIYGAIKTTKIVNETAVLQQQKTKEEVYTEVTTLYYNAQILKKQIAFADSNHANSLRLLRNMQLMRDQQLVTTTDVEKVQLQTAQLETQKANLKNNYAQVLNALKLAMGIEITQHITVESEINYYGEEEHSPQPATEYQLLLAQNKLLRNELDMLNKSRFLPVVNLIASYGKTGFGYDKSPNHFLDFYDVGFAGVQFSFPLFNGMTTKRRADRKKIEITNNELQTELAADGIALKIKSAEDQRQTAFKTIDNTQKQVSLAAAIYNQTLIQQQEGVAGLTEVLLADNALREAQQQHISAIVDYLKADLNLKSASGNIKTK